MNLERFAGWLALVANLGVVGGLVLLAFELRQNTSLLRAQAVTNRLTGQASAETAFMGEDTAAAFAKALEAPETLDDREIVQLWAYLNVSMMAVEQTHSMYTLGLATEEDQRTAIASASGWLGFPFGRIWWNELRTNFPSDLTAEIDAQLEANPDLLLRQFEGIRRAARGLAVP